jgi:hypothetical protein
LPPLVKIRQKKQQSDAVPGLDTDERHNQWTQTDPSLATPTNPFGSAWPTGFSRNSIIQDFGAKSCRWKMKDIDNIESCDTDRRTFHLVIIKIIKVMFCMQAVISPKRVPCSFKVLAAHVQR